MDRRRFVKTAATGAAGSALIAAPAIAQSQPKISWRLTSSYPKSLDTLFGLSTQVARRVAEATDGNFQIQVFAPGEIVPGLQALDAVQSGTVECSHTLSSFYIGKDPAFAFETSLPFGFNTRQQNAWLYAGGGLELCRAFMRKQGLYTIPSGNTGAQMGGWFRKEIKSLEDLKGLKMRIAGLGGQIMSKLGVVPQQIAGGDIYPALERGTLDAVEFSGPREVLLLSRLLGGERQCQLPGEPGEVERPAGGLQGDRRGGLRRGQRALRRQIRPWQPRCADPACRHRRGAAALPAGGHGRGLQGGLRHVCRPCFEERRVQDVLRFLPPVLEEGEPLVPRRRAALRRLQRADVAADALRFIAIASAARQSRPTGAALDCFVAPLLAMTRCA